MDASRYLECLAEDYGDLRDAAASVELTATVPSCAIVIAMGQQAWTVRPAPGQLVVEGGGHDDPRVLIDGPPGAVLRWLWGRAGDDAVRLAGDPAWADYLRRMLALVTR